MDFENAVWPIIQYSWLLPVTLLLQINNGSETRACNCDPPCHSPCWCRSWLVTRRPECTVCTAPEQTTCHSEPVPGLLSTPGWWRLLSNRSDYTACHFLICPTFLKKNLKRSFWKWGSFRITFYYDQEIMKNKGIWPR